MSVRTDTVNLVVNVNGNAAQNQLNELRKRAADLTFEMKNNLKKGTDEYIVSAGELKKVTAEMSDLKKNIGLAALSMKELAAERRTLTALLNSSIPLSKEYKDAEAQLQKVIARQNELKGSVAGMKSVASSTFSSMQANISGLVASYLGFQAVITGVRSLITGAIKLSDQLGDLRRVAGLTAKEADNLNQSLLNIDTRTSDAGLLSIAIIAGKLGVAKEDIFSFTKAVDKLVVTLGDELGNADQITTQLGKILNVFDGKVTGDNISYLGNAIVDLANKGVATGGFIVDFTQRVAGIAKASNLSLGATVGLAAGLEGLGLRAESSSSALQRILMKMAIDVPKAAKIAGVPLKEFNQLFAEKPQEALIKYAEGLVKNKNSFVEVTKSFKDADEANVRTAQTLQAIGQSGEYMRTQIDLGTKSIKEQISLDNGFAIKNDNLAGSIEKVGKQFDKLVASKGINSFLKGVTDDVNGLFKSLTQISDVGFGEAISRAAKGFSILMTQGPAALDRYRKSQKELRGSLDIALPQDTATKDKKLINPPQSNKLQDQSLNVPTDNSASDSAAKAAKAEYDRLKKDAENFYKELQKIKQDAENSDKTLNQKELINLENKYADLHARALEYFKKNITNHEQYNAEEKILFETFNSEVERINKKQFGLVSEAEYSQALNDTKNYFDHQKNLEGQKYAQGLQTKQQYDNAIKSLDTLESNQRIMVAKDYSKTVEKAASDLTQFKKDQEKQQTDDAISEADKRIKAAQDEVDAKKAAELKKIDDIRANVQQFQDAMTALNQWVSNSEDRQLERDKQVNDKKKANLQKQLDEKLISQKQYDKKVQALDEEQAKKQLEVRRKQAEREKALQIFNVVVDTAAAIAKTFVQFGFPLGIPFAAAMAAIGAIQIGAIASAPLPTAGTGDWFKNGKKHSQGGIPIEIERDEAVMQAKTMTDNKRYTVSGTPAQITSKLNSMHGGKSWAEGANIQMPAFRQRAPQLNANLPGIISAGLEGTNYKYLFQQISDKLDHNNFLVNHNNSLTETAISETRNSKDRLHAVVSIKEIQNTQRKYDAARRASGMSQ